MTQVAEALQDWYHPVKSLLDQHRWSGGFIVSLPEYRPDLVRSLASCLGLAYFDFRLEVMQPLAWKAIELQIHDLDRSLVEQVVKRGLVAQNVEALLATKTAPDRRRWLSGLVETKWPQAVVVPLALYGQDAPARHSRVVTLSTDEVPEQSLISRLVC